ncbi:MAG: serine/threonine protein kinase [Geminocystis sp.]|nr:serine/threonine protein kinase [Geminocystis sp.]HIK37012.1 serine/threonine protein kinase [Geminocystis sp. M7585_C2015_104]
MSHGAVDELIPPPYQLVKKLGSGSFGHVYLVTGRQGRQYCVIKQLHPVSNAPNFLKQARRLFQKEAEVLKKLNHPQIPKLIDYFEYNGDFYLVEEYIEGHTLRQELIPNQPLPEEKVVEILQQGLEILRYIHSLGVIHRDVKPDNFIRRRQDNQLVLIDFGAVKEFNLEQSRLINPTVALGTRGYMPTEQARGKPHKNSDIYALGVIAIEALTGKNPLQLEEDEGGELIWRPFATVSPPLADIISKMVRYNCKQRYQAAEEVIADLEAWRQQKARRYLQATDAPLPSYASPQSSISNKRHPLKNWLQSPVGSTFLTASIISVIATGGVYYLNQQERARLEAERSAFLASLEEKYNAHDYTACFEQAEERLNQKDNKIPTSDLSEYIGKCRLEEGKKLAQFAEYAKALEIVSKITPSNRYYQSAASLSDQWSREVFKKAEKLYTEEGKLEEALKEIDSIPDNDVKKASLVIVSQWQEEYKRNSYLVAQAEKDLEYGNCKEAMANAAKIVGSNYWLLQGKKIVDKAHKCLEDQSKETGKNPDNNPDKNNSKPDGVIDVCDTILCPN